MHRPKLSAILLAAGSSTRMGAANKLLLPFRNKVIIQHLIDELAAAKIDELIVVLGYEDEMVKAKIPNHIRTVFNEQHRSGLTSSIQTGVRSANPEHQAYMICLADQVLMQTADYNKIITGWKMKFIADSKCIVLPFYQQQKGNPVIFSSCYKDIILAHSEDNGCKGIVQQHSEHLYKVEIENDCVLVDVDTEEDYERLNRNGNRNRTRNGPLT